MRGGPHPLVAALLAVAWSHRSLGLTALGLCCTLFFLNCSFWKLASAFGRRRQLRLEPIFDDRLPTYAVLVPLYREAGVVRQLVASLAEIDYPKTKLQIMFLVEADDTETRTEILRHAIQPHFEVIVVPPGGPRTKPKAL